MGKNPGRKHGKLQWWWQGEHPQCRTGRDPTGLGSSGLRDMASPLGSSFLAHLQALGPATALSSSVELGAPPGLFSLWHLWPPPHILCPSLCDAQRGFCVSSPCTSGSAPIPNSSSQLQFHPTGMGFPALQCPGPPVKAVSFG